LICLPMEAAALKQCSTSFRYKQVLDFSNN
jgi:hypothetical protein